MPSWVTIYCTENIDDVVPEFFDEIKLSDYWSLAEDYGVADHLVSPALQHFKISQATDGFTLQYRPAGERQLAIRCWTNTERVLDEIHEAKATLGYSKPSLKEQIEKTKAVIGIELGASQLSDMGIVFAYEVARWFGLHKGGLILGDDDNWSQIEKGGFVFL